MRKILIVISLLVILATSLSCLPAAPKTSQKDIDQDTVISDLKSSVSSIKESVSTLKESLKTVSDKVTTLENKPAPSTTPTDTYTKTQVDAAIAQAVTNAVNNLKNDQTWIKSTSTSSSSHTSSSSSNDVLDEDGDMSIALSRSVEDEVWLGDNVQQTWKLIIKNNSSSSHHFRLSMDLDAADPISINSITMTPNYSGYSGMLMKTTTVLPATNIDALSYKLYYSDGVNNKIYISKNKEEELFLTVLMRYTDTTKSTYWTWRFNITEVD